MNNTIVRQIEAELQSLDNQINEFKEAVAYLKIAKSVAENSVDALNHSQSLFSEKVHDLKAASLALATIKGKVEELIGVIDPIKFTLYLDRIEREISKTLTSVQQVPKTDYGPQLKTMYQQSTDASNLISKQLASVIEMLERQTKKTAYIESEIQTLRRKNSTNTYLTWLLIIAASIAILSLLP